MMNWWKWSKKKQNDEKESDKEWILKEINKAHLEWVTAQHRLNYALEKEQIDYAIFLLEAAEKRYGILLREAKKQQVFNTDYYKANKVAGE